LLNCWPNDGNFYLFILVNKTKFSSKEQHGTFYYVLEKDIDSNNLAD
jgi:hypothetical protein